jgi:hypothetical protein
MQGHVGWATCTVARSVLGLGCPALAHSVCPNVFLALQTDISEVVIKQMQQRHAQYANMTYRVSDCRDMPEFLDCSFGHVVDKGGRSQVCLEGYC